MSIESMIPEGWEFGYIMRLFNGSYECQLESTDTLLTIYDIGDTASEALQAACSQAREIAIKKLMEECISREDSL